VGSILQILLALGTLALPELLDLDGSRSGWLALGLVGLLPVPHLVAALVHRLALRGRFRLATLWERVLGLVPLAGQAFSVLLLGWPDALERLGVEGASLTGWPGIGLLSGMLPFLVLTWLAIDARARLHASTVDAISGVRAFHVRLFLSGFLPIALYLFVSGLVGSSESWRVHLEEVAALSALFTTAFLALFVVLMPRLLAATWDTAPIERGPLRDFLEVLAERARFRCRDLLVWRTGAQVANATIVGFTRWGRIVLFSDVLLSTLQPLEVGAVFGHEMGHARRKHAVIFAAQAIGVLLAADLAGTTFAGDDPVAGLWILAGAIVLFAASFGYLSRRFELEADLESLELIGTSRPLIGALEKVTGAHAYERSSWRHFSTADRVRFLRAVELDPEVGRALRRRLSRWSRLGFVFLAAVLLLQARQLAATWTEDGILVDLRLGRYERAAESVERARDEGVALDEERLEEWVELATTLAPEARTPAELDRSAQAAFREKELERALLLLELAYLRGSVELGPVLDALEALIDGERDAEAEEDCPAVWRELLKRFGA